GDPHDGSCERSQRNRAWCGREPTRTPTGERGQREPPRKAGHEVAEPAPDKHAEVTEVPGRERLPPAKNRRHVAAGLERRAVGDPGDEVVEDPVAERGEQTGEQAVAEEV